MTLQQLNYLHEVVKYGSINKAAKRLFVSQSTISSALKELENTIGVTIFERNNKGVYLTKDGQRFYERICPILEQEKQVLSLYSKKGGKNTGKIHISSQHYPFVTEAFTKYINQKANSHFEMYLNETNSGRIIDDVSSQKSDLGILFLSNTNEHFLTKLFRMRDLVFTPLITVNPHAFMRKGHPLSGHKTVPVKELEGFPFVVFHNNDEFEISTQSINFTEEIVLVDFEPTKQIIHINDRCSSYNIMENTDAISVGSGILPQNFSSANITAVPISKPMDKIQIGYIHQKANKPSRETQKFIAILEEVLHPGKIADLNGENSNN